MGNYLNVANARSSRSSTFNLSNGYCASRAVHSRRIGNTKKEEKFLDPLDNAGLIIYILSIERK